MNKTLSVIVFLFLLGRGTQAQQSLVDRFKQDERMQDSLIALIVSEHTYMSKVVDRVSQNPGLHKMLIQHLTRLLKEPDGQQAEQAAHDHKAMQSPYAGEEQREIKALSEGEVKSLLNGEGMGFAMAAELNHYPGPKHVLEMADQLNLTPAQKKSAEQSAARMREGAVKIGKQLIEKERMLDQAFAGRSIDAKSLREFTAEIGKLRGQLRMAHLAAHLEMRKTLSSEQIVLYDRMRGYEASR